MDNDTQQKRILVDAILMLERTRMIDFNGHASWRIPGEDRMLINAGASVRSALTIDDIVMTDSMESWSMAVQSRRWNSTSIRKYTVAAQMWVRSSTPTRSGQRFSA